MKKITSIIGFLWGASLEVTYCLTLFICDVNLFGTSAHPLVVAASMLSVTLVASLVCVKILIAIEEQWRLVFALTAISLTPCGIGLLTAVSLCIPGFLILAYMVPVERFMSEYATVLLLPAYSVMSILLLALFMAMDLAWSLRNKA